MSPKTRRSRRPVQPGRGVLVVIAALLLGSAVLRMGENAGQALALDAETPERPVLPDKPHTCENPAELQEMLDAFAARDQRLSARESALELRKKALSAAEDEIARQLEEMARAEARLRETVTLADNAAEDDLERLTKVYENMKPERAAALFQEMDPAFAAGFLGRMRPEAAAGIMAALTPAAAHRFSIVLAGRNANAPSD